MFFNSCLLYISNNGDKKLIWITGASSGIGKALAIKFAEMVGLLLLLLEEKNLLNELSKLNENIYPFPLDVTEIENCKSSCKKNNDNLTILIFVFLSTGMHGSKIREKDLI